MGEKTYSNDLPLKLYRSEQIREIEAAAIETGVASYTLMRRAANAVFQLILTEYPNTGKITVFCGTGNNGGDGYIVAILARQHGIAVEVVQVGDSAKLQGDALQAREQAQQDGISIVAFGDELRVIEGVIVDALLGIGLRGTVRDEIAFAIDTINKSFLPVVAVDCPSGVCADFGESLGSAVSASHTVSFVGLKQGLLTGAAPDYTGSLHVADLSLPDVATDELTHSSERLEFANLKTLLPPRRRTAHKGNFGHVMIVGGDLGMAGAAAMASQAAARVGAGLTSCATRPQHIAAIVGRCPEIMVHGVISGQEVEPLLSVATVIAIGPGLGRGAWGEQLFQKVCDTDLPLVVDADALNLIAEGRVLNNRFRDNWVLTPHPGEAAKLLACTTAEVQKNRFAAVLELQRRYGGVVILKGAGTLIADSESTAPSLCSDGNPGMASGGMGDVLSGVVAGLMAQGMTAIHAAKLGVCLHARAADLAAIDGERGLLATDLMAHFRVLLK